MLLQVIKYEKCVIEMTTNTNKKIVTKTKHCELKIQCTEKKEINNKIVKEKKEFCLLNEETNFNSLFLFFVVFNQ